MNSIMLKTRNVILLQLAKSVKTKTKTVVLSNIYGKINVWTSKMPPENNQASAF